jgi:RNA polymerase sigma-54 factor
MYFCTNTITVSLNQGLHHKLLQKLSPQQIQLMKLLQVPTANLEERIKEELEENPALEISDEDGKNNDDEIVDEFESSETDYNDDQDDESYNDDIDISEYVKEGDDDVADYKTRDDQYGNDEEQQTIPIKLVTSFNELMLEQLDMLYLNDLERNIAEQIVGSLDDDGYLRRETSAIANDLAFKQSIEVPETDIEVLIKKIQKFEPAGVAARNLQECLVLQLQRKAEGNKLVPLAIKALQKYFEEFTKKHYERIQKGLNISSEELKQILQLITKLNPKPAGNIGDSNHNAETYIVPDFFITSINGKLDLTLNSRNAPDLKISEGYRDMLKDYERSSKDDKRQKEAVSFIKQKIDSAKWFIDAIKQRQNTLLLSMNAIMQHQYQFFTTGDETDLRPMILKDIAEDTSLDISTISRVANSKFVQTEFGTYKLKFFFSESLSTDSGEEVSTREVKRILSDIIQAEEKNKPHSDELLTEMLQAKGYNIARRTVAKYREQLNIPVARLRKEF